MNTILARALKVGLSLTAVAGIVLLFTSGFRAQIVDVYLLGAGGVLLLALTRATRAASTASSSAFEAALAAMRRPPAAGTKLPLDRDVELSRMSAFHLHSRLRPVMREIAANRLRRRYGIELDAEPERARELVGPVAWELVRPDRPPPSDRLAAGPPLSQLREAVSELEKV